MADLSYVHTQTEGSAIIQVHLMPNQLIYTRAHRTSRRGPLCARKASPVHKQIGPSSFAHRGFHDPPTKVTFYSRKTAKHGRAVYQKQTGEAYGCDQFSGIAVPHEFHRKHSDADGSLCPRHDRTARRETAERHLEAAPILVTLCSPWQKETRRGQQLYEVKPVSRSPCAACTRPGKRDVAVHADVCVDSSVHDPSQSKCRSQGYTYLRIRP